ncbi:hypothetical protein GPZ05_14870 [Listeria monocytogenes]|nr:hypothetical protein [Listeria monocytogenes]EAF2199300.1 hypothetical protein [Listeria monocytogenes]EAF2641977.1 hypothetical protein [Listeria monocytogenes]EDN7515081.1 hypothetical protein [Listeria monocytogenes]
MRQKKIVIVMLVLILSFSACFIPKASAEVVANNSSDLNGADLVSTLDRYVYAEDNSLKVKTIPQSVYDKFGKDNVDAMIKGIDVLNDKADEHDVIITDNKSVYDTDDDGFVLQGGVNKVVYKWYGRVRYFSTSAANNFVYQCYKVAAGSAGVGAIAAAFSAGTTALFGGLTGAYFTNLALDVDHRNKGHKRGIILHVTWASAYWTSKQ